MCNINNKLKTYCELYWWNMGKKKLSFKVRLKDLLKAHSINFSKRKTEYKGIYIFNFKSSYNITFKTTSTISDFPFYAKQFIQMELVRMGDKSQLFVDGVWRSLVTCNF